MNLQQVCSLNTQALSKDDWQGIKTARKRLTTPTHSNISEFWVMIRVGAMEWTEMTAGFRGELMFTHDQRRARGWGTRKIKVSGLVDKAESFNAHNKGIKSLLAIMLDYLGKKNDSPLRILTYKVKAC